MKDIITLTFGKILGYDTKKRTYSVVTDDGRFISDCRKIGDIVNNTGSRKVAEIEKETEVLILLKNRPAIDAPDGYILGAFESYRSGGEIGTDNEKEPQVAGAQGFIGNHGRRVLLYPDGTIELKAGEWCNIMLNPEDNSISSFFRNSISIKDRSNFIKWLVHPKSGDTKNSLMHIGISGVDSVSKKIPDIEIFAGALIDLDIKGFDIDPGAKLAVRITNPDGDKETNVYYQVGDMEDGSIVSTKIKRVDGIDAEIKLGDMKNDVAAMIRINGTLISVLSDGGYSIVNEKTEIEATNDGIINIVCESSNLGTKDAKNHIAIAEEVVVIVEDLIDAIQTSTYMTLAPGSPTKPGPINAVVFTAIKNRLKNIISKSHSMDK